MDFRFISLEGDDWHLKIALLQLADEFDLEASEIEGGDPPQPPYFSARCGEFELRWPAHTE
jgi:hypothetical protein